MIEFNLILGLFGRNNTLMTTHIEIRSINYSRTNNNKLSKTGTNEVNEEERDKPKRLIRI